MQKLMEKKQRAMSSTPTGKALVLVHRILYLHHFLQSSVPQNFGFPSKVTTLAMDSMFFFQIVYSIYKQYLEFPGKCHCGHRVALHKLVIARDERHQYIDELHIKYHQQSDRKIFWPPYL